jgi:FkbM family methyltransferase
MSSSELEIRNGKYWWPKYAKPDNGRYLKHAEDMRHSMPHVRRKGVAVQAGGHVGMWPLWLSPIFDKVVTFEPHPINYAALRKNVEAKDNVVAINTALSDKSGTSRLRWSKNAGGHNVYDGAHLMDFSKPGNALPDITLSPISTTALDDMELERCDFLMLDVEGYELPALQGAVRTIETFHPVIQLEDRGHGIKKGRGDTFADIERFLHGHGYKAIDRVRNDVIFV